MTTAVRDMPAGRALGAGRRTRGRAAGKDTLTRGLGWFSLGLGAAQLLAPRSVERVVGVRDTDRRRIVVRAVGVRELASGLGILARPRPAGWVWARVAGDGLDLALLGRALAASDTRRGRAAAALAAVAGVTGGDLAEGVRLARGRPAPGERELRVAQAVTVNRSSEEVYGVWRDFERLPRFMEHVESVRPSGEHRWRWTVTAPAGRRVEWDAELVDDRPGELIAWRSLPGADVENAGTVRFAPAPGGRGTEVRVELTYAPPLGAAGATLAKLLGEEPEAQAYDDLRRFKQLVETGEIVRSEGTPEGVGLVEQLRQRAAQPLERRRERVGR